MGFELIERQRRAAAFEVVVYVRLRAGQLGAVVGTWCSLRTKSNSSFAQEVPSFERFSGKGANRLPVTANMTWFTTLTAVRNDQLSIPADVGCESFAQQLMLVLAHAPSWRS